MPWEESFDLGAMGKFTSLLDQREHLMLRTRLGLARMLILPALSPRK
jgi:hypothetical protein